MSLEDQITFCKRMGIRYTPPEKKVAVREVVKCKNVACANPVRNAYLNVFCCQKCSRTYRKMQTDQTTPARTTS